MLPTRACTRTGTRRAVRERSLFTAGGNGSFEAKVNEKKSCSPSHLLKIFGIPHCFLNFRHLTLKIPPPPRGSNKKFQIPLSRLFLKHQVPPQNAHPPAVNNDRSLNIGVLSGPTFPHAKFQENKVRKFVKTLSQIGAMNMDRILSSWRIIASIGHFQMISGTPLPTSNRHLSTPHTQLGCYLIPNGHDSECFFLFRKAIFQRVIIPKFLISKSRYPKIFIPKGH